MGRDAIDVNQTGNLGKANDLAVRHIAKVHLSSVNEEMMGTEGVKIDVRNNDEFTVF